MADKQVRHAFTEDGSGGRLQQTFRDESDGTYSPAERARLEVWDGSGWVKARANPKGALLIDRGTAGADDERSAHYTGAQSGTILYNGTTSEIVHVTAVIITVHNSTTASPAARISIGSKTVASHPGIPAGGGLAVSDIDLAGSAGDDITATCDAPTGGSIDFNVHFYLEASP